MLYLFCIHFFHGLTKMDSSFRKICFVCASDVLSVFTRRLITIGQCSKLHMLTFYFYFALFGLYSQFCWIDFCFIYNCHGYFTGTRQSQRTLGGWYDWHSASEINKRENWPLPQQHLTKRKQSVNFSWQYHIQWNLSVTTTSIIKSFTRDLFSSVF